MLDGRSPAIADPARRRPPAQRALGPSYVTDLARPFRTNLPKVLKRPEALEETFLVCRWVDGRVRRLSFRRGTWRRVENWFDMFRAS